MELENLRIEITKRKTLRQHQWSPSMLAHETVGKVEVVPLESDKVLVSCESRWFSIKNTQLPIIPPSPSNVFTPTHFAIPSDKENQTAWANAEFTNQEDCKWHDTNSHFPQPLEPSKPTRRKPAPAPRKPVSVSLSTTLARKKHRELDSFLSPTFTSKQGESKEESVLATWQHERDRQQEIMSDTDDVIEATPAPFETFSLFHKKTTEPPPLPTTRKRKAPARRLPKLP